MKTRSGKIVPTIKLDDFGKKILYELEKAEMTDKEIANKFRVDLDVVKSIKKRHCKGDKIKITETKTDTSKSLIIPNTSMLDTTEKAEEKQEVPSVKRTSSDRSKRTKISDDLKIELITTLEDHPEISINKIKDMFGISSGSVYNILNEFGYKTKRQQNSENTDETCETEKTVEGVTEEEMIKEEYKEEMIKEEQTPATTLEKTKEDSSDHLLSILSNFTKVAKRITTIEVYLCEGMHNDYIFSACDHDLNFYDLYKKACEWIDENIIMSNNKFIQKIILHTGLDGELMNFAVIKACESKRVNIDLVIKTTERRTETITMFHKFDMSNNDKSNIDFQIAQKNEIYLYGMKSSMEVNTKYYEIDLSEFDSRSKERKQLFIFNEKEDSWKYFAMFIDFINCSSERKFKATLNEVQIYPETGRTIIKPIIKSV